MLFPNWGVEILLHAPTINEVLEVEEVLNLAFEENLRDMDIEWLGETIVDPARQDQVH